MASVESRDGTHTAVVWRCTYAPPEQAGCSPLRPMQRHRRCPSGRGSRAEGGCHSRPTAALPCWHQVRACACQGRRHSWFRSGSDVTGAQQATVSHAGGLASSVPPCGAWAGPAQLSSGRALRKSEVWLLSTQGAPQRGMACDHLGRIGDTLRVTCHRVHRNQVEAKVRRELLRLHQSVLSSEPAWHG